MKKIFVTQRVDIVDPYRERRDALDQQWPLFLSKCNLLPILVPNQIDIAGLISESMDYSGILLTGGNSLVAYGGDSPERDEVEHLLLQKAIEKKTPVLGVCRGMQIIQDHFGVQLREVTNHVGSRFSLNVEPSSRFHEILNQLDTVNSYHEFGSQSTVDELMVSARSGDGVVMAVEHVKLPIFGQMWHSEREKPFNENELDMFRSVFC